VHENTIAYRVRQAEELLGRSLERDTVNLQVALELEAVVGRAIFVK
jgi:DNA-binding PucR family transcriptional regulator